MGKVVIDTEKDEKKAERESKKQNRKKEKKTVARNNQRILDQLLQFKRTSNL